MSPTVHSWESDIGGQIQGKTRSLEKRHDALQQKKKVNTGATTLWS
jgi:hypothetical protein